MMPKTNVRPRQVAAELLAGLTLLIGAACGPGSSQTATVTRGTALEAAAIPTLNTFDPRYLQIDACPDGTNPDPVFGCALDANGNPLWGPDANLFLGDDPADGSHSINRPNPSTNPVPATATWIDWNDLTDVANHVQLDWQASGKDPTAFPQSNECVGSAQVLSKMDLVNVGFSNNPQFTYLGVQRAGNSGDAGYYWIFTRLPPHLDAGAAPCSASQQRLTYDIQAGDVLLVGHYHPSATLPLLQAFKAVPQGNGQVTFTNYDAVSAIDYTNANLWTRDNNAVIAVAVNETPTAVSTLANGFGLDGMKNIVSPNGTTCKTATACLDVETFAEAAVLSSFFTGASACGVTFYGSIITRSSGSGGTSPDLKDLAGPYKFNFGSAKVQAAVAPSCDQKFGYEITHFQGLAGSEVAPVNCTWVVDGPGFTNFTFDATCSAYQVQQFFSDPNLNGTYNVKVTADDGNGCSDTSPSMPVNVYPKLGATATLTAGCTLLNGAPFFTASGSAGGGSGSYSYAWSFSGPAGGNPTPSSSTAQNPGNIGVSIGNADYTGSLTVTDGRTDITCTAPASGKAHPYVPLAIGLGVSTNPLTCPLSSTALTYTATPSGGSGNYTLTWNGAASGKCTGIQCLFGDDTSFCPTDELWVTVADADAGAIAAGCTPVDSKHGHYAKTTTVTGSVDP